MWRCTLPTAVRTGQTNCWPGFTGSSPATDVTHFSRRWSLRLRCRYVAVTTAHIEL